MTVPPSLSFRVSFADHRVYGKVDDYVLTEYGIDHRGEGAVGLSAESMLNMLPDVLRRAAVKAAARYVDYDAYVGRMGGDSAYMNECDRLAESFVPTRMSLERGAEMRRWRCNGIYLESDGDGWTGSVMAADEEEAKFQAKWQMALAAGDTRKPDAFVVLMDDCGICHVAPEPVLVEELAEAARDLLAEGPDGPAAARVAEMLEKLGMSVPAPTPRP